MANHPPLDNFKYLATSDQKTELGDVNEVYDMLMRQNNEDSLSDLHAQMTQAIQTHLDENEISSQGKENLANALGEILPKMPAADALHMLGDVILTLAKQPSTKASDTKDLTALYNIIIDQHFFRTERRPLAEGQSLNDHLQTAQFLKNNIYAEIAITLDTLLSIEAEMDPALLDRLLLSDSPIPTSLLENALIYAPESLWHESKALAGAVIETARASKLHAEYDQRHSYYGPVKTYIGLSDNFVIIDRGPNMISHILTPSSVVEQKRDGTIATGPRKKWNKAFQEKQTELIARSKSETREGKSLSPAFNRLTKGKGFIRILKALEADGISPSRAQKDLSYQLEELIHMQRALRRSDYNPSIKAERLWHQFQDYYNSALDPNEPM